MSKTVLTRTLEIIENRETPLSLTVLAQEIGQTQARTQEIVEYWIRRGKIEVSRSVEDCETCGFSGSCPYVLDLPPSYQVVSAVQSETRETPGSCCS